MGAQYLVSGTMDFKLEPNGGHAFLRLKKPERVIFAETAMGTRITDGYLQCHEDLKQALHRLRVNGEGVGGWMWFSPVMISFPALAAVMCWVCRRHASQRTVGVFFCACCPCCRTRSPTTA